MVCVLWSVLLIKNSLIILNINYCFDMWSVMLLIIIPMLSVFYYWLLSNGKCWVNNFST